MVASTWTVTAAVGPARWRTSGLTTRCMIASSTRLNVTPTTANVAKSTNPLPKPMNGFNDGTAREANRARYDHYALLRAIEDTLGVGTLGRHDQTATPIRH